jgi:TolA-binding protein
MTFPTKETPEEMEKRLRAKFKSEEPADIPPSLDPSGSKVKKEGGGGMGGMKLYAIVAGISFVMALLVVTFMATSPLTAKVNTVNTSATTALSTANTALDTAKKAQATADSHTAAITAIQAANTDTTNKINTVNGQITSLQGSITTINNQFKGFVTTDQIKGFVTPDQLTAQLATLNTTVDALKAQSITDAASIKTLQDSVKALQNGSSGTGGTTVTGVTATVIPNAWGTGQMITFGSVLPAGASGTETGSFNFAITNATTNTAKNIQLAIGLQNMVGTPTSSNGTLVDLTDPRYAATVTISMSGNGIVSTWTSQSTGVAGILGFVNNVGSGIFASLSSINQVVGTSAPYTVTVTVTTASTSTLPVPVFTIVPIVKVVSYQ